MQSSQWYCSRVERKLIIQAPASSKQCPLEQVISLHALWLRCSSNTILVITVLFLETELHRICSTTIMSTVREWSNQSQWLRARYRGDDLWIKDVFGLSLGVGIVLGREREREILSYGTALTLQYEIIWRHMIRVKCGRRDCCEIKLDKVAELGQEGIWTLSFWFWRVKNGYKQILFLKDVLRQCGKL